MTGYHQGDVITISSYRQQKFVIVSKNAFIQATGVIQVCPMIEGVPSGPLHIEVIGKQGSPGTVICEQIKLIDPAARRCAGVDSLSYGDIMNISDALQGMLEYD